MAALSTRLIVSAINQRHENLVGLSFVFNLVKTYVSADHLDGCAIGKPFREFVAGWIEALNLYVVSHPVFFFDVHAVGLFRMCKKVGALHTVAKVDRVGDGIA